MAYRRIPQTRTVWSEVFSRVPAIWGILVEFSAVHRPTPVEFGHSLTTRTAGADIALRVYIYGAYQHHSRLNI